MGGGVHRSGGASGGELVTEALETEPPERRQMRRGGTGRGTRRRKRRRQSGALTARGTEPERRGARAAARGTAPELRRAVGRGLEPKVSGCGWGLAAAGGVGGEYKQTVGMAESVELPGRLAILPFRNKVLLPGAIIRIRCTSPSSVKLVEQELWQREEKGLIGILPVRDAAAEAQSAGSTLAPGGRTNLGERSSKNQEETSDSHKHGGKNQQEVIHWHNKGVAARALHLSRGVEKPSGRVTYIVVLEGLCRFSVQELSTRGTYYTARIIPLDMTKVGISEGKKSLEFPPVNHHHLLQDVNFIISPG
ncbi:Lon protease2, peroxisomal [Sesamum angolense]|uniref:Lon protease2, peroxisomal n=1 Tax=Sesamum angolense TaxID=2727404 RepID=A0AAE1WW20_9LAMI|nr:Lon protease2, peroxisomal [Sesamum angolense]